MSNHDRLNAVAQMSERDEQVNHWFDQCQRLRSLLMAALPYVDASERSYARRLTWAILHPNDPRATALHVAGGNCPEETTRAA
jgi:hypothetical protein